MRFLLLFCERAAYPRDGVSGHFSLSFRLWRVAGYPIPSPWGPSSKKKKTENRKYVEIEKRFPRLFSFFLFLEGPHC